MESSLTHYPRSWKTGWICRWLWHLKLNSQPKSSAWSTSVVSDNDQKWVQQYLKWMWWGPRNSQNSLSRVKNFLWVGRFSHFLTPLTPQYHWPFSKERSVGNIISLWNIAGNGIPPIYRHIMYRQFKIQRSICRAFTYNYKRYHSLQIDRKTPVVFGIPHYHPSGTGSFPLQLIQR